MESKIKTLQKTKNIFEKLKTDPKSKLFSEDKINVKLLKKLVVQTIIKTYRFARKQHRANK